MVWVVVQTKPSQEKLAQLNLEKQGYQTYCPRIVKRCSHARKVQNVLRPLFPGYLFLNVKSQQPWRPIMSTFGVNKLVKFGEKPTAVSEDLIDDLRAREVDGSIPLPPAAERYKVGDKVRIIGGPLDDMIATVMNCDAKERIMVLLNFICAI